MTEYFLPRFHFVLEYFCGHCRRQSIADGPGAVRESRRLQEQAAKKYCPSCVERQRRQRLAAYVGREW